MSTDFSWKPSSAPRHYDLSDPLLALKLEEFARLVGKGHPLIPSLEIAGFPATMMCADELLERPDVKAHIAATRQIVKQAAAKLDADDLVNMLLVAYERAMSRDEFSAAQGFMRSLIEIKVLIPNSPDAALLASGGNTQSARREPRIRFGLETAVGPLIDASVTVSSSGKVN